MSKADILEEIPKLSPEDREEIRLRLDELDRIASLNDDDLSPNDLALVDARIQEHRRNPASAVPIEQIKADLRAQFAQ